MSHQLQSAAGPNSWPISSPNGEIVLTVNQTDDGGLTYQVTCNQLVVLETADLGVSTSVAEFQTGLTFLSQSSKTIHETYSLVGRKKSECVNHCNEVILKFIKRHHEMHLAVRVYNDGVAYRYVVPGTGPLSIYSEASSYKLPAQAQAWASEFVVNYEGFYEAKTMSDLQSGEYGMPILCNNPTQGWVLISEAAVYGDYCASHVRGSEAGLKVVFAPDQLNAVTGNRPFQTPWRAAIISTTLSGIVESNLIENLNPESEISDTRWIKPGRSAWSWWSGDSTRAYEVQQTYVDFAASMGWEYYLCDGGWNEDWLVDLVAYAKSRNVGIFVWAHHRDLMTDDDIEDKLSRWASKGVVGVKVDFFDSDSQETLKLYDKLAIETAKRHLMLNYHGSTKPSGERRKWPHLVTREGVLGAEYYKWSPGPTAAHNCTLPFTRNVVGPMDYTPVTFSNQQDQTTFAHQTALCIVFESSIQHFADSESSYKTLNSEVLDLFRACPAVWDDTKLIEGYPGQYITIARRTGDEWFIGSLCGGGTSREVQIPLGFLGVGQYVAQLYMDGKDSNEIDRAMKVVTRDTILNVQLLVNGGCSVRILPQSTARR